MIIGGRICLIASLRYAAVTLVLAAVAYAVAMIIFRMAYGVAIWLGWSTAI